MLLTQLTQTFQWGCGNYSGFGDGGAYDGDGVGDNEPAEFTHPYSAVAPRFELVELRLIRHAQRQLNSAWIQRNRSGLAMSSPAGAGSRAMLPASSATSRGLLQRGVRSMSFWAEAKAQLAQSINTARRVVIDGQLHPEMERQWITFDPDEDLGDTWSLASDANWGGTSECNLEVSDDGIALFSGNLSLEMPESTKEPGILYGYTVKQAVKTGMCGIFSKPNSLATDLEHVNSLRMKLLGDGRRYIVSLRSKACRDGDFYQTVIKPPSGTWSQLTLPIDNFQLTHYGMINTNTVLMDTREVITFGLTIQDSVEGPFSLKIKSIEAIWDPSVTKKED